MENTIAVKSGKNSEKRYPKEKLTDFKIASIKSPAFGRAVYPDAVVTGLSLRVTYNGHKSWVLIGRVNGGQRKITIGVYLGGETGLTKEQAIEAALNAAKTEKELKPPLSLVEAREASVALLGMMRSGIDPVSVAREKNNERILQEKIKETETYGALRDKFLKSKEPITETPEGEALKRKGGRRIRKATYDDYRYIMCGVDLAPWEKKPLSDITRKDIRALLDSVEQRVSHVAAHKTFAVLRAMYNWGMERDIIAFAPTDRMKPPERAEPRARVLTNEELHYVWHASSLTPMYSHIIKLLILTGQRKEEIGALSWSEISSVAGGETIIELSPKRTKNGLPHIVPLAPLAAQLLAEWKEKKEAEQTFDEKGIGTFLFTSTGRTSVSGYSRWKSQLDRDIGRLLRADINEALEAGDKSKAERLSKLFALNWAGLDKYEAEIVKAKGKAQHRKAEKNLHGMTNWIVHDLRRTFVTGLNELGIQPHIVEAIVNHVSGKAKAGVAGTYNRALYLAERKVALKVWAQHLEKIIDPSLQVEENNVVSLSERKIAS